MPGTSTTGGPGLSRPPTRANVRMPCTVVHRPRKPRTPGLYVAPHRLNGLAVGVSTGSFQTDVQAKPARPDGRRRKRRLRTRFEMSHGLTGRAGRREPASSVAPIAFGY